MPARAAGTRLRIAAAGFVLAAAAGRSGPMAGVRLVDEVVVVLGIKPLSQAGLDAPRAVELIVDRGHEATVELAVAWPDAQTRCSVLLRARSEPGASGGQVVRLAAETRTTRDGLPSVATRVLAFDGATTALFEIARNGDRPLTLAIEAETRRRTGVATQPSIGSPVMLLLEVQRLDQGRAITLETNQLSTFVGESVAYSFRLGPAPDGDAAEITLTPLELDGNVVHLAIEVTGTLPGSAALVAISRNERWLTSRGSTSTLAIEAGDPPSGYRFLVTPVF